MNLLLLKIITLHGNPFIFPTRVEEEKGRNNSIRLALAY